MERKLPLSVAIITKDEEESLPACLQSVSFADDVVVVDSGSTDKTVEIAKRLGARVFIEEWKGYGPQKNMAVARCLHEWVLILDADERLSSGAKETIEKAISGNNAGADAYSLQRKNFLNGRWIKRLGWWPDELVRLVRKDKGSFASLVHEKWTAQGGVSRLNAAIEHHPFTGYEEMLKKLNEYSGLAATELFRSGKRASSLTPFTHGAVSFAKMYFLKLGFLEGFDGFIIAATNAGGSFFKYAKLKELQDRDEKNSKTR